MEEYILELKNITKTFPGIKALDSVSFSLKKGEIHALMGENGAGKSTFIKVITGVHAPDKGQMLVEGKQVEFKTPNDAQQYRIAAIYQHVTCYPDLSVAENIFMGHEKTGKKLRLIDWKQMNQSADELLQGLGADFHGKTIMGSLSVAQQQIVEIAKALSTNAQIIIMDEPTAALTQRETEELYRITERLRSEGKSIIFISHKLEDMYRLADRVTVLRDGGYIGTWDIDEVNNDMLIMAMVGREISNLFPDKNASIGNELFRVEELSKIGLFADINFSVRAGEILGITGLVGAGRTEVCQAIYGILHADSGRVLIENREVKIDSPRSAMKQGIAYLPEDRQKQGLILSWGIGRNITLSVLDKISKRGWTREKQENELAYRLSQKLNIKARSISDLASSLSGGNQQKVIVAKLLALNLKIIILDEPTKGVDVGAKYAIYEIMNDLARQGFGIIMVSSDMQEVLSLCDRIVVMKEGRITGVIDKEEATQEGILELAIGAKNDQKEVMHRE